jgi:hypothetical protein
MGGANPGVTGITKVVSMTQPYFHLAPKQLQSAVKLLDGVIGERRELVGHVFLSVLFNDHETHSSAPFSVHRKVLNNPRNTRNASDKGNRSPAERQRAYKYNRALYKGR